jgi:SAM and SH3 domain-containing protein 1
VLSTVVFSLQVLHIFPHDSGEILFSKRSERRKLSKPRSFVVEAETNRELIPHLMLLLLQSNDARNYPKDLTKDNSVAFKASNGKTLTMNSSESTKDDRSSMSDQAFNCSASSVDSLPSVSGSSEYFSCGLLGIALNQLIISTGTQALVRSGSPNSSLSADDKASALPICRAKAISDSVNSPFEKETLKFKVSG